MSSKNQILNSIKSFQNQEKLEFDFDFQTKDCLDEFIANAKLVGAVVHTTNKENIDSGITELIKDKPDHFIYESSLGVAENGALWCQEELGEKREKLFTCNDLILKVEAKNLVYNMHQAYEKVSFESAEFGTFIAGPSKTADIEQSLVIGAHGAISLHIFIIK